MVDANAMDAPAYPWTLVDHLPTIGEVVREQGFGLSQRAYAAIALKVPDSGLSWLDAMIERSRRDQIAQCVLPYTTSEVRNQDTGIGRVHDMATAWAYEIAESMLAASRVGVQ